MRGTSYFDYMGQRKYAMFLHIGASSSKNVGMSAQTARAVIHCVECRKPRVVYVKTKIDIRHKMMLARNISSFEFTWGGGGGTSLPTNKET